MIPQSIVYSSVSYTLIYIICIYTHIYIYYYISKTLVYSMNLLLSTIEMYIYNVNLTSMYLYAINLTINHRYKEILSFFSMPLLEGYYFKH